MRIIKYNDKINKKYAELEVDNSVALFLMSNDKMIARKQNQYDYHTVSMDTEIYNSSDDFITLADTIADEEEKLSCKQCKKKLNFYNLIWKVASKLTKKQYDLIWDIFVENKSQKQLAEEFNTSESNISQLKNVALNHLAYQLYTDNEFMQTDLYKRNKREFEFNLKILSNEMKKGNCLTFNLNNIYNLVKDNTQMLKSISSLGIELDQNQKELFTYMNRVVKQTLDKLDLDCTKSNILNIPNNFEFIDKREIN